MTVTFRTLAGIFLAVGLLSTGIARADLLFDFDFDGTTTQSGWTSVLVGTIYGGSNAFGWDVSPTASRDRGAPVDPLGNMYRDLQFCNADRTFKADLAIGDYVVTCYWYETTAGSGNPHDHIRVSAEGVVMLSDVTVPQNTPYSQTFNVTVNDGRLDLLFHDNGGADLNWIINGVKVAAVPEPATLGFLAAGGAAMAGAALRRRSGQAIRRRKA